MNVKGIKRHPLTEVTDPEHWEFPRDKKRQTENKKKVFMFWR